MQLRGGYFVLIRWMWFRHSVDGNLDRRRVRYLSHLILPTSVLHPFPMLSTLALTRTNPHSIEILSMGS